MYEKFANWKNLPDESTPITAAALTHIEQGITDVDVTRPGTPAEAELSSRLSATAGSAEGLVQAERAAREAALALKADSAEMIDALGLKANASAVYTKAQVDAAVSPKANSADVYTKSFVYTKGEVNSALGLKANIADVPTNDSVYTKTEVDGALGLKANSADVYTKAQTLTGNEINLSLTYKADKTAVYTKAETYSRAETGTQITNAITASRPPLYGTGFPNGAVAAPVGTLYSDTAVTNGASLWQKVSGTGNTGWKVVSGDTGVRNISSLANPVWDLSIPAGGLFISRVGPEVTLRLYGQLTVATTRPSVVTLPVGFRAVFGEMGAAIEQTGAVGIPMAIFSRTSYEVAVGPGLVPAGQRISAVLKFTAIDSDWPATLPGTN